MSDEKTLKEKLADLNPSSDYRSVWIDGEEILLTPTQGKIVKLLYDAALSGNAVVSKKTIFDHIHGIDQETGLGNGFRRGSVKSTFFRRHHKVYDKVIRKPKPHSDLYMLNI